MTTKHSFSKKILGVLLALLMVLSVGTPLGTLTGLKAKADTWNGAYSDPGSSYYTVSGSTVHLKSAQALAYFIRLANTGTNYSGMTVYLDVDVDLNSVNFGDNVLSGGYNDNGRFKGTFDGQNHTISNFKMVSSDHRVAMFRTTENATFRNLNFSGVLIDDVSDSNKKNGFAVLSGYHGTGSITFENVHVNSGNIYGYNYVGALVGEVGANSNGNTVTITNCSNGATINALNVRIGGLVGSSLPMVIATNCSNTGNVTGGSTDVGGIVGWIEDDPSSFTDCSNSGAIQGTDSVGGILGYFGNNSQDQKLTLTNNTNTGMITSNNRAAGICALIDTDNNAHEISGNVNRGTISAGSDGGGIVARNKGFGVWTNNRNYGAVTGGNDNAGGICAEVEDDKQVFSNCYNSGAITGQNTTGGIMGWLDTAHENTFDDCGNSGAITSTSGYAAGIVGGCKKQITFTQCYNVGAVKGAGDSGGICAHADYHIFFYRCFNAGSVDSNGGSNVNSRGGLIGYTSYNGNSSSTAMVDDCINWGSVSNGQYTGGLVGRVNGGNSAYKVQYSYNCGPVSGGNAAAIISSGGTIGSKIYYNSDVSMGTTQGEAKTNSEFINYGTNGFTIYSTFCQNTWGVKIGSTTYKYPIHVWYRNLFKFNSTFIDTPSSTNTTITKLYNTSFTTPTVSGVSGVWANDDNWNAAFAQGASVNPGVTSPTNTYVITQETSDVENIHNDTTYNLQRNLSLNTEQSVVVSTGGEHKYFRFTPSESGQYVFFTYGTTGDSIIDVNVLDPSASNGKGALIGSGDDYGGASYGNDPSLTNTSTQIKSFDGYKVRNLLGAYSNQSYCVVNLTAGTTYVADVRYFGNSTTGSYPLKVCKVSNITFNATGGATTYTVPMPAGHTMKMDQSGLSRTDHTLIAWSTEHSGAQNKTCMASATITVPSSDTSYYALWNPGSPTAASVSTDYTASIGSDYQVVYYSFTPSETRKYSIHSTGSGSSPDPYVILSNAGNWASSATYIKTDDNSGGSNQFAITDTALSAGTAYLIGAKLKDGGTGNYTFRIDPIYNVTYNANGGSGAPAAQEKFHGVNLTLSSAVPTLAGYHFLGWATSDSATAADYAAGGTYSADADVTLYAVWEINSSTLRVDPNGGVWNGSSSSQSFTQNYNTTKTIADPSAAPSGKHFKNWSLSSGANGSFSGGVYTYGSAHNVTDTLTANYENHSWTAWSVTTPATCTANGVESRECTVCHTGETRPLTAPGHTLTATAASATTCTEPGNSAYWTCSVCHKYFSDAAGTTEIAENSWIINATGHSLTATIATLPTCTLPGNSAYWTCSVCYKYFSDAEGNTEIAENSWIVPANGHSLTATSANAATCTEAGNSAYWTCSVCNKYFSDDQGANEIAADSWIIPATGHTLTATSANAPSCTEAGNSAYWTCSVCHKYFSDAEGNTEIAENSWIIPATGHTLTATSANAATCTEAGNSAYWTCSVCHKYFSDDQGATEIAADSWIISANGHSLTATSANAATCTEAGNSA
ncbi:MAG: InlB B-repeat-containing protein, partial [Clostridia bacterium]|nr:InlB B-repeat-containing protein [Clostridia bacterium]